MAEVHIRSYTLDDFPALVQVQRECFPPPFPSELWWNREQITEHTQRFPEGALCAEIAGEIVGSATALVVTIDPEHPQHTWEAITDSGYLRRHQPTGDSLYGVDIAVKPACRGRGVARALYQARYALVRQLGLRRFIAGSRISGYHHHRDRLTPEAYVEAVIAGHLTDPVITPQMRAGLTPVHLLHNYLNDEEAANCALLMEWTP
jgi:ribosomal protein S18 acetylase RimI-like enzyme